MIEKPFGHDLQSARELAEIVHSSFQERQIYRIDHYLGKETVQNIFVFRFANAIFEPVWTNRYVDHVQITVAESLGVEHRAAFYEETGVVRDIVQNHLLQVLALVAMEPPAAFEADAVRDEKTKVLRATRPLSFENSVRGQYGRGFVAGEEVVAYTEEQGVPADSNTPTFIAAKVEIDNWRWAGTPFYIRTGKRLPKRVTEVAVQFKGVPHLPFTMGAAEHLEANSLVLRIQPDEGISLRFGAKAPSPTIAISTVNMDFLYGSSFMHDVPEAYETLILDAIRGDRTLFTPQDGVERSWEICDPLLEQWRSGTPQIYAVGLLGPGARRRADHARRPPLAPAVIANPPGRADRSEPGRARARGQPRRRPRIGPSDDAQPGGLRADTGRRGAHAARPRADRRQPPAARDHRRHRRGRRARIRVGLVLARQRPAAGVLRAGGSDGARGRVAERGRCRCSYPTCRRSCGGRGRCRPSSRSCATWRCWGRPPSSIRTSRRSKASIGLASSSPR